MIIRTRTVAGITGIALFMTTAWGLAAQPEGLYAADQLLDADVYAAGTDEAVGEIDDILLDNDMRIKSFVVEADGGYGLGGKSYVVPRGELTVETVEGDQTTEPKYRANLAGDVDQLSNYPKYDDAWWSNARAQASEAWKQTKASAASAWTQIKEGTNELIDRAQGQTDDAAETTGDAADNAADQAGDAADDATQ